MDLSEITPVAQDYLKAIWTATEWGEPPITTTALAARFGTSAPNVTDTVKRLAAQGLVEHQPYRPVTLTPTGRDYAVAMVRRHRLLETFLVATLGYRWEEVHEEAERLEHAVSDVLIERIDAALGHPGQDPHGDPIPTAAGHIQRAPDARRLDTASDGPYEVIRISDTEPERLARLRDHRLTPGTIIHVIHRDPDATTVRPAPEYGPVPVPTRDAAAVWVRPHAGHAEGLRLP